MPTLTLELPETAYRAALTLSAHERDRLAAIMFTTAEAFSDAEDEDDGPDYDRPTNAADLEAIGRGIQAEAEGRTTPGDVVFARYRERFGKKPSANNGEGSK